MEKVVLNATKRDVVGKQVKALRREGKLPAVIYGRHTEPVNINLDAHSASLALGKLTSSSLVTINVDGTEYPTLVREKQRDYIKNRLLHVDFLAVSLDEKIRTYVMVNFIGVSLAVKDYNAVLVKNLEQLEVECLPTDLPERIDVDISALTRPGEIVEAGGVTGLFVPRREAITSSAGLQRVESSPSMVSDFAVGPRGGPAAQARPWTKARATRPRS